jgi:hypothetical protein
MEIAANGGYPFVPITTLHAIVDGYGLPSSSFHAPNSLSPNLPARSIDVQSTASAQHRSNLPAIGTKPTSRLIAATSANDPKHS